MNRVLRLILVLTMLTLGCGASYISEWGYQRGPSGQCYETWVRAGIWGDGTGMSPVTSTLCDKE